MRGMSAGLLRAVAVASALALVTYVASTTLLDGWLRSRSVPAAGRALLPAVMYNAPATVATTERRGPVGPVAAVFAGTRVLDGLVGELDDPWIAVSSRTGDYRALSGPDLPEPTRSGVAVSPDGSLVAWAGDDGVVVHDARSGENRVLPLPAATAVGAFAPDGRRLLVQASELRVVDVVTGREVASLGRVPARAVAHAAWRPDGTTVSLVDEGLVGIDVGSGRRTRPAGAVSPDAQLAWSPSGERLVTLQEISGVLRLEAWEHLPDGRVRPVGSVPAEGIAVAAMLGFTGEEEVAVAGRSLETGAITRLFEVAVDGSSNPAEIGQLPGTGANWVGEQTLEVATEALRGGTHTFAEPRWPWSHRAKLVASLVLAAFALGMYLTRRPARRGHSSRR